MSHLVSHYVDLFQGLTLSSLKHHVALQPLFAIMGLGMIMVGAYLGRLAIKTTDVSWKKEEQPYNYYRNKQFKFLNPSGYDYSKFGNEIPNYQKEEK